MSDTRDVLYDTTGIIKHYIKESNKKAFVKEGFFIIYLRK